MSKLQALAARRAKTPGGLAGLLGGDRKRGLPRPQAASPEATPRPLGSPKVEVANVVEETPTVAPPGPSLTFAWETPKGTTTRISPLDNDPHAVLLGTLHQIDTSHITFTNNVKVTKPKKKKKKAAVTPAPDANGDSVTPAMAKLTIKPKPVVAPTTPKLSQEAIREKSQSPTLSFITIGHVDSGKSTTLGRFLYDTKVISGRQLNTLAKQAADAGKGSFSLAWVMDQTPEERSRGVTVDTVQCGVEIHGRKLVLVDSPGHSDYLPSVVNGVIGADVAVVVVDSSNDLIFNLSNAATGVVHTREQLLIAKSLGISKVLVLVNKLDIPSYEDSQIRFETIVGAIQNTLVDVPPAGFGFDNQNVHFVPVSGINGDNIVNPSTNMGWYTGPTMLQVLESWYDERKAAATVTASASVDTPLIFNITDVINSSTENTAQSKVKDNEVVAFGRIHSGHVRQGDVLVDSWGGERGQVDGIWSQQSKVGPTDTQVDTRSSEKIATKGDFVELKLKKVGTPKNITVGDVLTRDVPNAVAQTVHSFTLDIDTFDLDRPLLVGSPLVVFRGGRAYDAQVEAIHYVVATSPTTGKLVKKKGRNHLGSNQRASISLHIPSGMGAVVVEGSIAPMDKLNRVVLRKDSHTLAGGVITALCLE